MSPRPSRALRAVRVEDGSRVHLGGKAESYARRDVCLDQAGDDIDRWPLRRQHQVNSDRACHLRQARDRFFDVGTIQHHQVGQLVDDDDDVGQRLCSSASSNMLGVPLSKSLLY